VDGAGCPAQSFVESRVGEGDAQLGLSSHPTRQDRTRLRFRIVTTARGSPVVVPITPAGCDAWGALRPFFPRTPTKSSFDGSIHLTL
jgi:hypothetical protein